MNFYSDVFVTKVWLIELFQSYLDLYILLPILIVIILLCLYFTEWAVRQPSGVLVFLPPRILTPPLFKKAFSHKFYQIIPLADYKVTARVLGKELYRRGAEAGVSPIDLLFGWKNLSDTAYLKNFHFSVAKRWYMCRIRDASISVDELRPHLDNNHLIPATPDIEFQLKKARIGHIIYLEGMLVKVIGPKGFAWESPLSIGSTGGTKSCKIIYVVKFDILC